MAEIRLVNVSRTYDPVGRFDRAAGRPRGEAGQQYDRAFADRMAAQAEINRPAAAGRVKALDNVTLTVADGETLAVVGPSGCGKSTLLRVIAGLDTGYSGEIYYGHENVRDVPVKDRYIGMVFQNYALYPHFQGRGNLRFFFQVRGAPDAEAEERIRITAEIMGFGFSQLLDRKPGTLSGGQQQRLAIARALVRNPKLFLFDEPLSNLDAKLRTQTRIEIRRLLNRFSITALYVTHDQVEAMALGDRIAVMRDGRIEQIGAYDTLRNDPNSAFVAGFLGPRPMNLLAGASDGDGVLHVGGFSVMLPPSLRLSSPAGRGVTLGVHTDDAVAYEPALPAPAGPRVKGTVEMIEPDFGRRQQSIFARAGEFTFSLVTGLEAGWHVGEEIEVVLPEDRLYFFDTESGARLR
ncbi:MAG: sn-glycerol-3-phosphate import ATP-binding protein UgpC [Chloroflexi bacterium ADurb.Bin325]|nr:MAG: sn-glycerol-3-phosphate import ATP-binding protein UgpC [Chloroflexi bacterium ADurb.Bin325]